MGSLDFLVKECRWLACKVAVCVLSERRAAGARPSLLLAFSVSSQSVLSAVKQAACEVACVSEVATSLPTGY